MDQEKTYTYDEAYKATLDYFFNNEITTDTFLKKYLLKNKNNEFVELSPDDSINRLCSEFARIDSELYNKNYDDSFARYYDAMSGFARVCAQGSPMCAIGNKYQVISASNCVVAGAPKDSIHGIFSTGEKLAQLYKRRCGVGSDLSELRPAGATVNNAARTTTGAWSFADYYSSITNMIGQKARRGALMLTLDVRHPDVLKFATCKHDKTKVTGANISIKMTDDFMHSVDSNTDFDLRWPVDSKMPSVIKTVKAKDVWNTIIESATLTADPGLMFFDTICKNLPAHCYEKFKTVTTNPCFSGDTMLAVADGRNRVSIKQLAEEGLDVPVYSIDPNTGMVSIKTGRNPRITGYNLKLIRVHLDDNTSLDVTPDHKFLLKDGSSVLAKDLKRGDSLPRFSKTLEKISKTNNKPYYLTHCDVNNQNNELNIQNVHEDPRIVDSYNKMLSQGYECRIYNNKVMVKRECENCLCDFEAEHSRREVSFCSRECHLNRHNSYKTMNSRRVANTINTYKNKSVNTKKMQAKIWSDLNFDLNRKPLLKEWGQSCKDNNCPSRLKTKFGFGSYDDVCNAGAEYNHKVCKIEALSGEHTVYNITVDDNHTLGIITSVDNGDSDKQSGVFVFNCGEVPLSEMDSCRLMSINLTGYVRNAFKKNASFDMETFDKDIRTAMNMIDNLVDIEIELINKIKAVCDGDEERVIWESLQESGRLGRRTGLGTHALADTLAQLNIKYDSDKSIHMIDSIYRQLRDSAYDESINLAKERGAFPEFNFDKEKDCEFIKRLPKNIIDKMKKYGRRNISILTQAPTGTTAIVSKVGAFKRYNTSSGIEPVFRNAYTRRKKINPGDSNVRVDFVDNVGESWQEFRVFHSNVSNYLEVHGLSDDAELPDIFVTSDQISWQKRIELQGAEQQYIDHSISATINLPRGTKPELVSEIYMMAWKSGLKGVTVYVEGSKSGVLVSDDENDNASDGRPKKIAISHAPKRPAELPCDIQHATVKGKRWTILVGTLHGMPYEIFAGLSKKFQLPEKYRTGKIVKSKKGQYNLHVDVGDGENLIIEDIIDTFDNPESAWATRMISTTLRHGTQIEFICDQLNKDGFITDINKVLARSLKKYIKEGSKVSLSVKCQECGSDDLIYTEGCVKCISCNYSRCG